MHQTHKTLEKHIKHTIRKTTCKTNTYTQSASR